MKFSAGDLVAWYEYYACGSVCKDTGLGIIISGDSFMSHEIYKVLIDEENISVFSNMELDSYDEFLERQRSAAAAQEDY